MLFQKTFHDTDHSNREEMRLSVCIQQNAIKKKMIRTSSKYLRAFSSFSQNDTHGSLVQTDVKHGNNRDGERNRKQRSASDKIVHRGSLLRVIRQIFREHELEIVKKAK